MELLREKNEEDHNNFLDVIEEDYKWLRDKCEIFLQKSRLSALLKATQASSTIPCIMRQVSKRKASLIILSLL